MKGLGQLIALSAYLMAASEKEKKNNSGCRKRRVLQQTEDEGVGR